MRHQDRVIAYRQGDVHDSRKNIVGRLAATAYEVTDLGVMRADGATRSSTPGTRRSRDLVGLVGTDHALARRG